ncbi:hypothetical protein AMTRI_Chr03g149550 [Amborella trichopoda]|uniref:Mal d 1-associated protein n=1 Tax=Amborella trichopoda TaxID=13333 RepID=W1NEX6_AMBTC|nr:uncharacterized protein LOC18421510 [Amborella trichopoda]ERM93660.1 hypothetical protein AMTR_s00004p00162000 [Amborella trichopoda]|eukprot:XP_006826423.1 uncharacterized protein LOC18421510 [Amborella trichopoda]
MAWKWKDDTGGEMATTNPNNETLGVGGGREGDMCSTRRIVKSSCKTEEVAPGKFIRKCEKSEQVFRDCMGRPTEVVESNTEFTEHDVSNEMVKGSLPFESIAPEPFSFPGLRSDIDSIERSIIGSFDRFLEAAEEMSNDFFHNFGASSRPRGEIFDRLRTHDNWLEKEKEAPRAREKQTTENDYKDFAGQIREV